MAKHPKTIIPEWATERRTQTRFELLKLGKWRPTRKNNKTIMDVKDTLYRLERQSWSNEITDIAWMVNAGDACTCSLCLFLRRLRVPANFGSIPVAHIDFVPFSFLFPGSPAFVTIWGWAPHWPRGCFPWSVLLPLRAVVLTLAAPQMTWRPTCCFRWARSMR